jgi:hypothetical protein
MAAAAAEAAAAIAGNKNTHAGKREKSYLNSETLSTSQSKKENRSEEMSHQEKKKRKTLILWDDNDSDVDDSTFVEESTYIAPYRHQAANEVEIYFKAGTKEYALAGRSEDNKLKISPVQLKKKYRFIILFFA